MTALVMAPFLPRICTGEGNMGCKCVGSRVKDPSVRTYTNGSFQSCEAMIRLIYTHWYLIKHFWMYLHTHRVIHVQMLIQVNFYSEAILLLSGLENDSKLSLINFDLLQFNDDRLGRRRCLFLARRRDQERHDKQNGITASNHFSLEEYLVIPWCDELTASLSIKLCMESGFHSLPTFVSPSSSTTTTGVIS